MVRIRLKRMGRKNRPFYRIAVFDARTKRDGRTIEILGHYDPLMPSEEPPVQLKADRVKYWLGQGAQPTETVASLFRKHKLL
jgi:small subunit ribosomal protein S16